MNHQTYFNRNMVNGVNGRYPKSRVDIQEVVEKALVANDLDCFREIGITHVLLYKDFVIDGVDNFVNLESNILNEVVIYNHDGYVLVKL